MHTLLGDQGECKRDENRRLAQRHPAVRCHSQSDQALAQSSLECTPLLRDDFLRNRASSSSARAVLGPFQKDFSAHPEPVEGLVATGSRCSMRPVDAARMREADARSLPRRGYVLPLK